MLKAAYTSLENVGMRSLVSSSFSDENKIRKWGRGVLRKLVSSVNSLPPAHGLAEVLPGQVVAGSRETITVNYIAGLNGLKRGARLILFLPQFWGGRMLERDVSAFALSGAKGTYFGYLSGVITAQCSKPSANVEGTVTCSGSVHTAVDLELTGSDLEEGDLVSFIIGDSIGNPPICIEFSGNYKFVILIDEDGKGDHRRIGAYPSIDVIGGRAAGFRVSVPSVIRRQADTFDVSITPVDRYMNQASGYMGRISVKFAGDSGFLAENTVYKCDEGRFGVMAIKDLTLLKPGFHQVVAADLESGLSGISNPMMYAGDWPGTDNVYFGDIHAHTELSDAIGRPEDAYIYGRDVLHHDFGALSDHFEETQPTLFYKEEQRWPLTVRAAEEFNKPGEYATLLGYEWAADGTHKNIYYRDGKGQVYSGKHPETPNKQKHMEFMKKFECIAIPHHPKYLSPVKWDVHSPDIQRLVEIYSAWGSSEEGGESSVISVLNKGWKLGIIGGTDNHIGRLGLGNIIVEGGGIAAVLAPTLSRESVYDALKARRCYGTTGARILLDFRLNGWPMGSEVPSSGNLPRVITAKIGGEYDLEKAEIIKNGEIAYASRLNGRVASIEWTDPGTCTDPAARTDPDVHTDSDTDNAERKHDYYYIRISQKDGHRAWSSPIFAEI